MPHYIPLILRVCIVLLALAPSASASIDKLRFSPNGLYLLAQSAATVSIFGVPKLASGMQISVQGLVQVGFTPDSTQLLLLRKAPNAASGAFLVERWNFGAKSPAASSTITTPRRGTVRLSPDGRVPPCEGVDGTFHLLDA